MLKCVSDRKDLYYFVFRYWQGVLDVHNEGYQATTLVIILETNTMTKQEQRNELKDATEQFIACGGVVRHVPANISGLTDEPNCVNLLEVEAYL